MGTLLMVVIAVITAVVLFLAFPPPQLLRRAALPLARVVLNNAAVELGGLDLSLRPQGHIILSDLYVGPPKGYKLPLFTAHRVDIAFDASQAAAGLIVVEKVQIERPVLRVETREGKPNWQAFLESLPQSKPAPLVPTTAAQPAPSAGKPSAMSIELRRLALIGLAAYIDDGNRRAVLNALDITAMGAYSTVASEAEKVPARLGGVAMVIPGTGHAVLRIHVAPPAGHSSLVVSMTKPQPVTARLATTLDIRAQIDRLAPLAGRLAIDVATRSQALKTRWKLPPLDLGFNLVVEADQRTDEARVSRASLRFAGEELLALAAKLRGLATPQQGKLELDLERLQLPLTKLARYAKAFAPGIEFGGALGLRQLRLRAPVAELGKRLPPRLDGRVELSKVWAKVDLPATEKARATKASLKGLSGRLLFAAGQRRAASPSSLLAALPASRAEALKLGPTSPSVAALLKLDLDRAAGAGARVDRLRVRVAGGANLGKGLTPQAVAAKADVGLGASYRDPKLGPLGGRLRTSLALHADLVKKNVAVKRLSLVLDELLRLTLDARARGFGNRGFDANIKIAPVSLARLVAKLPGPLRRKLPLKRLRGRLGLSLSAQGRTPAPGTPPLRLPINLDARVDVKGVDATLRGKGKVAGTSVKGLALQLKAKGRPSDLQLSAKIDLATAREPSQGVRVERVSLPLALRLRRHRVDGSFGLKVSRLRQLLRPPSGRGVPTRIEQRGMAIDGRFGARLPVERLIAGRPARIGPTKLDVMTKLASVQASMPGVRAQVRGLSVGLGLDHQPKRKHSSRVALTLNVDKVDEQRMKAAIRGVRLAMTAGLEQGVKVGVPVVVTTGELAGETHLSLDVASVRHPAAPKVLRKINMRFDAALPPRGPLTLRRLQLQVPDYGAEVALSGKVFHARRLALDPRYLPTVGLPELRLTLGAFLASASTQRLVPGVSARGRAGVRVELTRRGRDGLRVEGRLQAKDFFLTQEGRVRKPLDDGGVRLYTRTLRVRDLDADVPIVQTVKLRFGDEGVRVAIPSPRRSIFADASLRAVYRMLRPFTGRGGNFSLAGVTMEDRLDETSAAGAKTSSTSTLKVGRTVLDLSIADSTVRLDQLYMKLFGGDIFGSVQAQLPRPQWLVTGRGALDARLRVDARLTNVDLAYLDPEARREGRKAKISSLIGIKTRWAKRDISGRVMLTDIAMKTLDSLLAFLDPHKLDESVQANRKLLTAWYTRLVNPRVKNVTVWLDHSRLNLDIELDALWPFGALLKQVLKNLKIRRVSIKPYLPKDKAKKKERSNARRRRRARRRRGDGWLP